VLLVMAAVFFFRIDLRGREWIQQQRTTLTDAISRRVKPLGDGRYMLPPLALVLCWGYLAHNSLLINMVWQCFLSFALTGAIAQSCQFFIHRHRPNDSETPYQYDGPLFTSRNRSFPSGHASVAFCLGTVLASTFTQPVIVPIAIYTVATLTALSRLNDNMHWLSDVFTGTALGILCALASVQCTFV